MPFAKKPQVFSAKINELTLGTGDKATVLGGQNVFNLYSFDAPIANRPKIGIDVSDDPEQPSEGLKAFYAGCNTLAERAKKAAELPEVDFVCIRFDLADPNGENKSIEDCVSDAKAVAGVVDKPLVVAGCKNSEKDADLFAKISEALQGKNILVLSAKEENYKGYGFEYVVSTLERVKAAALSQNDATLQMPIITPVGVETWGVKEATAPESDVPEWGCQEERGIDMEVETAAACLAYGSDAVILRHPVSIQTTAQLIAALM